MGLKKEGLNALQDALKSVQSDDHTLTLECAFTIWICEAFLVDNRSTAIKCVTDGPRDRGIDALYIDTKNRQILFVQTKCRKVKRPRNESLEDTKKLISAVRSIASDSELEYRRFRDSTHPSMHEKLDLCRQLMRRDGYHARLYFATTGRFTKEHRSSAKKELRALGSMADLRLIDRNELLLTALDYAIGATPPVHDLLLPIDSRTALVRDDYDRCLKSWVFTMKGSDVAEAYKAVGDKIFARNIRGFLSDTAVNARISETLKCSPERFWYYNNGITIICRAANPHPDNSELRVERPQIVNGLQTTRALAAHPTSDALVLVKVIAVPAEAIELEDRMDDLISTIVESTNNQNPIKPSDLRANDGTQIRLQRAFERAGYYYMRKRESRKELARRTGNRKPKLVKRDELAQAVGACLLDPYQVRAGKERLFQGDTYNRIFGDTNVGKLLLKLELSKRVKAVGSGHPNRAYSKWHCLHTIWSEIREPVARMDPRKLAEKIKAGDLGNDLDYAISNVYKALEKFYTLEKRLPDRVLDVSAFFYRPKVHLDFDKFWNSRRCKFRTPARGRIRKFVQRAEAALKG